MTQEEINQLHALLAKAREVIPNAYTFTTNKRDGEHALVGERITNIAGYYESWTIKPDGNIEYEGYDLNKEN